MLSSENCAEFGSTELISVRQRCLKPAVSELSSVTNAESLQADDRQRDSHHSATTSTTTTQQSSDKNKRSGLPIKRFKKRPGCADMSGEILELKMATLLYLRALNSGLEFELVTNLDGVGDLDDCVFRVKLRKNPGAWFTIFMQLKYKESAKLTLDSLKDTKKAFFNLRKYAESYKDISILMPMHTLAECSNVQAPDSKFNLSEGSIHDCLFVLYTNAQPHKSFTEMSSTSILFDGDEFFEFKSGNIYLVDQNSDATIDKTIVGLLDTVTDVSAEFLKNLRICCGQPNIDALGVLIKKELLNKPVRMAINIEPRDIDSAYQTFLHIVMFDWWKNKNEVLNMHGRLLSETRRRLTKSDLCFNDAALLNLKEEIEKSCLIHIESSERTCLLSRAKLEQAIEDWCLFFSTESLVLNQNLVAGELMHGRRETLVFVVNKTEESDNKLTDALEELCELVPLDGSKTILILSSADSNPIKELPQEMQDRFRSIKDTFEISQLIDSSQDMILKKKLNFQDTNSSVHEIFGGNQDHSSKFLNSDVAREIIFAKDGQVSIAPSLAQDVDYYIPRILERATSVEFSIFEVDDLPDGVTVVFSSKEDVQFILDKLCPDSSKEILYENLNMRLKLEKSSAANVDSEFSGTKLADSFDIETTEFTSNSVPKSTGISDTCTQHSFKRSINADLSKCDSHLPEFEMGVTNNIAKYLESYGTQFSMLQILNVVMPEFYTIKNEPDGEDIIVFQRHPIEQSMLGFTCDYIGLRFGQESQVSALRMRPNSLGNDCEPNWFLFVPADTKDDDVAILSKFNKSQHFISLKDKKLKWKKSLRNMAFVRKHLVETKTFSVLPETVTDFEERLTLLCAEPGMGKTTQFIHLAKRTKEALPHFLVLYLSLNDHTKLLSEQCKEPEINLNSKHGSFDAYSFLLAATATKSNTKCPLLKMSLEVTGNVIVFIDGFDEIAPRYVKECCALVSSLLRTKAKKIWISSRNSIEVALEDNLNTLATKLRKFDEDDQKSFLNKFWKGSQIEAMKGGLVVEKSSMLTGRKLDAFIDHLLELMSQAIGDRAKDFMGIPLQTQIMAEVYEPYVTGSETMGKIPDSLDLLELLDQFVDRKLSIYVEEKKNIKRHHTDYEHEIEKERAHFLKFHMISALVLILGEENLEELEEQSKIFLRDIEAGEEKTGIIDRIINGKPQFVHRVLAEYFVAQYLATNLKKASHIIQNFLFTDEFSIIRKIFDQILAKNCNLHTAVLKRDTKMLRALLAEKSVDANNRDLGGRTPLHLVAALDCTDGLRDETVIFEMLDLLASHTTDFNQEDDLLHGSPLRYADITKSWTVVNKLLSFEYVDVKYLITTDNFLDNDDNLEHLVKNDLSKLMDILLNETVSFEIFQTVLLKSSMFGSIKVAKCLVKERHNIIFRTKLEKNARYEIVRRCYLNTKHFLLKTLKLRNPLTPDTCLMTSFFGKTDVDGFTALHHAALNGHDEFVAFLIDQGTDLQIIRGNSAKTPLHLAAKNGHHKVIKLLLDNVCRTKLKDYVNLEDRNGVSALHLAAYCGSIESVNHLILGGSRINKQDKKKVTPLIKAAEQGHDKILQSMLTKFQENVEGVSTLKYIEMKNVIGWSALHQAAINGHTDSVSVLIQHGANIHSVGGKFDCTALQLAAEFGQTNVVKVLLKIIREEEKVKYVNAVDNIGCTALYRASMKGNVDAAKHLITAGALIKIIKNNKESPLTIAASKGFQKILEILLNSFDEAKEGVTKLEYLEMKNDDGRNALHRAAINGHTDSVSVLIENGANIQSVGGKLEGTALHFAAEFGHTNVVKVLVEAITEEEKEKYVNADDNIGCTALYRASLEGRVNVAKHLVNAGAFANVFTNNKNTPLMMASFKGFNKILEILLNSFDEAKEGVTKLEYIEMKDADGLCGLHLAALKGHTDSVSVLIKHGANIRSVGGKFKCTALHLAAEFGHTTVVKVLLKTINEEDKLQYVNTIDNIGCTALYRASMKGNVDVVKHLVSAGALMKIVANDHQSPLIAAAAKGFHETVAFLLNTFNDAKEVVPKLEYIEMKDSSCWTALHRAAINGHTDSVSVLIEHGANIHSVGGKFDCTALQLAAEFGHTNVVKVLLKVIRKEEKVKHVNAVDNVGCTALYRASMKGNVDAAKHLVAAGAFIKIIRNRVESPLTIAASKGFHEVVTFLLSAFNEAKEGVVKLAYIETKNADGRNALHEAAMNGHTDSVSVLIKHGANIQSVGGKFNSTALNLAAEFGHTTVVKVLLDGIVWEEKAKYISAVDNTGRTALHRAFLNRNFKTAIYLIKTVTFIKIVANYQRSPIIITASIFLFIVFCIYFIFIYFNS